jgi:predicted nucleic acid-binding protein
LAHEVQIFTQARSEENVFITHLLDEERAMLVGVVLCELIQRTRSAQDQEQLPDTLIALPYLEMTPHTRLITGELRAMLKGKGSTIGLPNLIVTALAQEYDG